jgi:hypothetical protein
MGRGDQRHAAGAKDAAPAVPDGLAHVFPPDPSRRWSSVSNDPRLAAKSSAQLQRRLSTYLMRLAADEERDSLRLASLHFASRNPPMAVGRSRKSVGAIDQASAERHAAAPKLVILPGGRR